MCGEGGAGGGGESSEVAGESQKHCSKMVINLPSRWCQDLRSITERFLPAAPDGSSQSGGAGAPLPAHSPQCSPPPWAPLPAPSSVCLHPCIPIPASPIPGPSSQHPPSLYPHPWTPPPPAPIPASPSWYPPSLDPIPILARLQDPEGRQDGVCAGPSHLLGCSGAGRDPAADMLSRAGRGKAVPCSELPLVVPGG